MTLIKRNLFIIDYTDSTQVQKALFS